jgi:hypothetical protein
VAAFFAWLALTDKRFQDKLMHEPVPLPAVAPEVDSLIPMSAEEWF